MRQLLFILVAFIFSGCGSEIQDEVASAGGDEELGQRSDALRVCADGPTVEGIDVSKWQGRIDWDAVAATEVRFAFIRVSDGTGTFDEQFNRNWAEARRVGLLRGVYQYFRPGQSVEEQANILLENMGPMEPGVLPPVIDVEDLNGYDSARLRQDVAEWIRRVEGALGVRPIVYTGPSFWNQHARALDLSDYPLWIANWGVQCPDVPGSWNDWVFHQYTATGRLNGISGDLDRNRFNGTVQALELLAGGVAVCGDGFCSGAETGDNCPDDCPVCPWLPATGGIVSEQSPCFQPAGPLEYWREEMAGHDGHLYWTHTTDNENAVNYATWTIRIASAGRYRLEAYTASGWGMSRDASYAIEHQGGEAEIRVDQSAQDGWALVGDFEYSGDTEYSVRLDDNTGEPNDERVKLVADALRLTRLDLPPEPDAGLDDAQPPMVARDMGVDDEGVMQVDSQTPEPGADANPGTDAGVGMLPGMGQNGGERLSHSGAQGCDCRAAQGTGSPWWVFLILACCPVFRRRLPR